MNDFDSLFSQYVSEFNTFAADELKPDKFTGRESSGAQKMLEAMYYSLSNGGKRIRPVLVLEFCRACGGDYKQALPLALAVEMVHTYSLIHDDLPCMDDDDIRRGKPSNHVVYGYANALLAGDGLLTLAFEEIMKSDLPADVRVQSALVLSEAAGFSGMIAGQVMDLENENTDAPLDVIRSTDERKTGEMIKAASVIGCIAAGKGSNYILSAEEYSRNIGLAFQIVDDILDVTSSTDVLGKPVGSDDENNKSTYVSLLGLSDAAGYAQKLTDKALSSLDIFGEDGWFLRELAVKLNERKN